MTTSTKVNSFTILKTKNQFILLCCKNNYGICAPTFGSTLTMANFPAGWPRLNAKIHKHLNYCQTIADQKQKHQSVLIESIGMTLCVISFLVYIREGLVRSFSHGDVSMMYFRIPRPFDAIAYGTPEGTFSFLYLSEKKLKQENQKRN